MGKLTPSLAAETEALREAYAALNRNDIPATVNAFDPQIEWTEPAEYPGGGTYHGHAGVKAHLSQSRGTWAEGSCEPALCQRHVCHTVAPPKREDDVMGMSGASGVSNGIKETQSAQACIVGPGAAGTIGTHAARFGRHALVIGGTRGVESVRGLLLPSLEGAGVTVRVEQGEHVRKTRPVVDALVAATRATRAAVVIACGGGAVM